MAFDPIQEDCLRLILSSMQRDRVLPLDDAAYIAHASNVYQKNPAALIRTDRDRSFHLVSKATELIDYRVPFLTDEEEVDRQLEQAEHYLHEAIELDASNWDAKRMLATIQSESDDELIDFLTEHRDAVAADAASAADRARDPYELEYARDLGQRPHLRWLAALASRLLIAGQYRRALAAAEDCLTADPADAAGARHTGMLALAKLEAPNGETDLFRARHAIAYQAAPSRLAQRSGRHRGDGHTLDAWSLIAEMSLAYRALDLTRATSALRALMRTYRHAAAALYFQAEFPDGVFARVNVEPGSEDELVLALSEATPLLQEGMGTPDAASFALWVAEHPLVQQALSEQDRTLREQLGTTGIGGAN